MDKNILKYGVEKIYDFDISASMIDQAKLNLAINQIEYFLGDFADSQSNLPDQLDLIIAMRVLNIFQTSQIFLNLPRG